MLEESLRLKEKLKSEIKLLKGCFEENKESSLLVSIKGVEMYFDPEILLKEKEEKLKNVDMYYEEYLSISTKIASLSKNIAVLRESEKEEDFFYYNGIPFLFKVKDVLFKLEKDLDIAKKQHSELYTYLKKGKSTY